MDFKWDNYQTLITVPATDCNFKAALKNADDDELSRAGLHLLKHPFANKSRTRAIYNEIKRREKEAKS